MALQIRSPHAQIKTLQHAHSAPVVSKTPVVINTRALIPLQSAEANELNGYCYEGEISGAPKAAGAIGVGAAVYWDATAGAVTTTSTSNTAIGFAIEAMEAGDTTTGLIAYNAFA